MDIQHKCRLLLDAYKSGILGQTRMPEDTHPEFLNQEERLAYFTLPMALNYQRDSYKLWEAAKATYLDHPEVFDIQKAAVMDEAVLRSILVSHKLALQPTQHIRIWKTIATTIANNWGAISRMLRACNNDFLVLQQCVQESHKKGFPYLSGPKIFHYWCFILQGYGEIQLVNAQYIDIAPDTHILQCSVKLGVISSEEMHTLPRTIVSERWRKALAGSQITPISMHPALWFWSRNGFTYTLPE